MLEITDKSFRGIKALMRSMRSKSRRNVKVHLVLFQRESILDPSFQREEHYITTFTLRFVIVSADPLSLITDTIEYIVTSVIGF